MRVNKQANIVTMLLHRQASLADVNDTDKACPDDVVDTGAAIRALSKDKATIRVEEKLFHGKIVYRNLGTPSLSRDRVTRSNFSRACFNSMSHWPGVACEVPAWEALQVFCCICYSGVNRLSDANYRRKLCLSSVKCGQMFLLILRKGCLPAVFF